MRKRTGRVLLAGAVAGVGMVVGQGVYSPASAACPGGAALHVSQPFVGTSPPQAHVGYTCYDVAGVGGHILGAAVVFIGPQYGVYADAYYNVTGSNEYTGGNQVSAAPPGVTPTTSCAVDVNNDGVCEVYGIATTPADVHVRVLGVRHV